METPIQSPTEKAERVATRKSRSTVEHVVFDLDDTLLDTSRQLIPQATREACLAMIAKGLQASLDQALATAREREVRAPRHDLFISLVKKFGVSAGVDPVEVTKAGHEAFYNRKVEKTITVFPEVHALLSELRNSGYRLHLVTQGHRATQEEKIRILKIGPAFESIFHVDPARGERKGDAFRELMERTQAPASHYLSIGNRIDTDIAEAKQFGWKTCWVQYGEYRELKPTSAGEQPDFTIESLSELTSACQL